MKAIEEVRGVIDEAVKSEFGSVPNVEVDLHRDTLTIRTDEETPWDRAEVKLYLQTDIRGDNVHSYYISYFSGSSGAEFASRMSFLLAGAAAVGMALEKFGIPAKK